MQATIAKLLVKTNSCQLLVSRDHLDEDNCVLIVDDFLSSGSSQEALLWIINKAGATAVGVAVLLEKEYEDGREYLCLALVCL